MSPEAWRNVLRFPHLSELARRSPRRKDFKSIAAALASHGNWKDVVEWGVGKETVSHLERFSGPMYAGVQETPGPWYEVSVKCDWELKCRCPSVDRAVEWLGIFEEVIWDLYGTLGWASWAARDRMDPGPAGHAAVNAFV